MSGPPRAYTSHHEPRTFYNWSKPPSTAPSQAVQPYMVGTDTIQTHNSTSLTSSRVKAAVNSVEWFRLSSAAPSPVRPSFASVGNLALPTSSVLPLSMPLLDHPPTAQQVKGRVRAFGKRRTCELENAFTEARYKPQALPSTQRSIHLHQSKKQKLDISLNDHYGYNETVQPHFEDRRVMTLLDHTQSTATTAASTVSDPRPYQESVYPDGWYSLREDGEAFSLHAPAWTLPVSGRTYTLEMWDRLPNCPGEEIASASSQEGCEQPEASNIPPKPALDEPQNITGSALTCDKANADPRPEPTEGLEQDNVESNTCSSPTVAAADELYYGFTPSELEGSIEPNDALLQFLGESGFDLSLFEPSNAGKVNLGALSKLPDIADTEEDLQVPQEQEHHPFSTDKGVQISSNTVTQESGNKKS